MGSAEQICTAYRHDIAPGMGLFLLYGKIIMRNKSLARRANNRAERPRKVAIYIRVSTTHQIDKDSLPMQRKDLVAYCELILGIEDYEIFEDAGYSGKNTDRPAFQEMMQKILCMLM